jgi:multidrug efflux system outer membrane protein
MNKSAIATTGIASIIGILLAGCAIIPEPISPQDQMQRVLNDVGAIYKNQEPLTKPLTLYEAIARALKYNFDYRLSMMEAVLQDTQLDVATVNMLPKILASAGYDYRDPELASSSRSIFTGQETLSPSTSQDKGRFVADLTFSWNILDFGLSYFQAKQQADRVLVAQERRRKVINNIIRDVIAAYWTTAIAERLTPKLEPILAEAQSALAFSRQVQDERLQALLPTLEYQKDLLRIVDQLEKLRSELQVARAKLAALVNVPMSQPFTVVFPEHEALPELKLSRQELETMGLLLRPDLREETYQERISSNEVYKELLKILPGISVPLSLNYDSNHFLVYQFWYETGVRTTLNLINLVAAPKIWKSAETQLEVAQTRRLATSVAAMAQINIGYQQYLKAMDSYKNAATIYDVEENIAKLVTDAEAVEAQSKLELIRRQSAALASQLQRDRGMADLYGALANVYASIGLDPYTGPLDTVNVRTLARDLEKRMEAWQRGNLPIPPEMRQAMKTSAATDKPVLTPSPVAETPAQNSQNR